METVCAIELRNITKRFGSVVANDGINLALNRGEILSLLGENGSGKTTLMNMLSGIYFPDEGQIYIHGKPVTIASPKDAFNYGIGMIHQHFKLVDVFTATENIVLGLEGKLDLAEAGKKVKEICDKYGFDIDPNQKIYDMSVSQKQTVEIVKVLFRGADILILDGISSETYAEQGMLEDLSGILKEAGLLDNIESAYTKEDGSIYEMPVKFGIPMIEGNKEDVQEVTDLASLADVLTKHKDEYGLTSESIYKLPLLYSMYPQALLEKLADNSSAAWMKKDGTLDEEKIKVFLEQSERIYQAGKDAMDELKAAYPQAFDDSGQPVYERAGSISGETAVLLSHNCIFALGDIFSPLDFAFVNSMEEIDTSLSYALWNGQMANCFIPVSRIGISSRASQKAAAEKFVEYLFSEEGQMLSREDGFPVVEAVYNGEDYWNQGEAGNVLVTGGSSNSENGQELVYSIKVPSADKVNELKQLGKMLTTPVLDNTIITSAVCENGVRYLNGEISLDEAVNAVMQQVNLYLAE